MLGTAYSDEELAEIVKEVDKLGDNEISMQEFEDAMRQAVTKPTASAGPAAAAEEDGDEEEAPAPAPAPQ